MSSRWILRSAAIAVVVAGTALACGDGTPTGATVPDLAGAGREVASRAGCAACHGAGGVGGVGPAWVGLAGSTVELDDGTQVVADDDYLFESISNPQAKRVEGFTIRMPDNSLSDVDIRALVAYIDSLRE